VIRKLVRDLDMPMQIVIADTVRETDGLALSSRNAYLNRQERAAAPALYRALMAAKAAFDKGQRDADVLRAAALSALAREPLAQVDYVSINHPETLKPLSIIGPEGALISLAVQVGAARLIDNIQIG
jgi:pantoate--beta-alanine ligase